MLTDRVIGAFTFRRGVYAEVEQDTSFTPIAWILVTVAAFLNQLGSFASGSLLTLPIAAIGGVVFLILGFVVGVLVINWVGQIVFKADTSFGELVRTLGLAYVWQAIGVLGILSAFFRAISDVLDMVMFMAAIVLIIAWVIAAKQALGLSWVKTIITVAIGGLAQFVIRVLVLGLVLGLLELSAGAIG